MVTAGLFPDDRIITSSGVFLTFIVPALGGCNLACAFCIVKQRREIDDEILHPDDLGRFISETARASPLFALGIQGHEPLLPASRSYTQAILDAGVQLGCPTTLVTNGVYLREAAPWLADARLAKVGVSIDSPTAAIHDNLRGLGGAWAATVDGVRHARGAFSGRTRLTVTSILMPSDPGNLQAMPGFLQELGVDDWIVTPLLRIGHKSAGGPVADPQEVFDRLLVLQDAASRADVRLTVDDELDCLQYDSACELRPELKEIRVRRIPSGVQIYRLAPGGQCSAGCDILTRMTPAVQRWRPGEIDASCFLGSMPYPGNHVAV